MSAPKQAREIGGNTEIVGEKCLRVKDGAPVSVKLNHEEVCAHGI